MLKSVGDLFKWVGDLVTDKPTPCTFLAIATLYYTSASTSVEVAMTAILAALVLQVVQSCIGAWHQPSLTLQRGEDKIVATGEYSA